MTATPPDSDLIRVVHSPGCPFDLGVVERAYSARDGSPMPGCFVILWHSGEAHGFEDDGRCPTVSIDPVHCRRVFEWSEAAFARLEAGAP